MANVSVPANTQFGLFLASNYAWSELMAQAQLAEALGFDSIWVADQFVNPYNPTENWLEGWTLLAALAAQTSRIRLGTLVTHVTYRNPAILARQALTLDLISNGRFTLGIGAGGSKHGFLMTGVPVRSKTERHQHFEETVQIVDRLLRNEQSSFNGRIYQIEQASMNPRPIQQPRPPMTIAAHGPKALQLAATYGDCWNSFYAGEGLTPKQASDITGRRNEKVTEVALAHGRNPDLISRSFTVGYTSDTPFITIDSFNEFIARYRAAGINEFILGYLPGIEAFKGRWMISQSELETFATASKHVT